MPGESPRPGTGGAAKFRQFLDKFRQNCLEARYRLAVGGANFLGLAKSLDNQVDRAVVEVKSPAVF
jgi:hypothetical protein